MTGTAAEVDGGYSFRGKRQLILLLSNVSLLTTIYMGYLVYAHYRFLAIIPEQTSNKLAPVANLSRVLLGCEILVSCCALTAFLLVFWGKYRFAMTALFVSIAGYVAISLILKQPFE